MFVSGVVAAGETYDEAAQRELGEELGIRGPQPEFLFRCLYQDTYSQAHIAVYRVLWDGPLVLQASEIQGGRYYTEAELSASLRAGLQAVPDGAFCWAELLARGLLDG